MSIPEILIPGVRTSAFKALVSIVFVLQIQYNFHKITFFFNYYRPQTKFAKVMFLHLSVILSTGGWGRAWQVGRAWQGGVCGGGVCMAGEVCVVWGMHGRRGHAWWGACVVWGMHGGRHA